eukprot:scaffold29_cov251-Pinguiococcus_pyrenoidosus.AAC.37
MVRGKIAIAAAPLAEDAWHGKLPPQPPSCFRVCPFPPRTITGIRPLESGIGDLDENELTSLVASVRRVTSVCACVART